MPATATPPHRISGNLALDLANTVSWRGTPREVDYLTDVAGLTVWARAAGLVEGPCTISAQCLQSVRALRAAVIEAGNAIAGGDTPGSAAVTRIRDFAAQTLESASLEGVPATIVFAPADRILGPLAWSAFDLLRGEELARLKRCPPDDCHWLFIDRTKNGSRRWCDMASCGNRAKARRGSKAG